MPKAYENVPMKMVSLEKVTTSGKGKLPEGAIFNWTYKSVSPGEAVARAHRALVRAHPDENALNWRVVIP